MILTSYFLLASAWSSFSQPEYYIFLLLPKGNYIRDKCTFGVQNIANELFFYL